MVVALNVKTSSIDTKLRRQRSNLSFQVVKAVVSRRRVVCEAGLLPLRTIAEIITDCDRSRSTWCKCDAAEGNEEN